MASDTLSLVAVLCQVLRIYILVPTADRLFHSFFSRVFCHCDNIYLWPKDHSPQLTGYNELICSLAILNMSIRFHFLYDLWEAVRNNNPHLTDEYLIVDVVS